MHTRNSKRVLSILIISLGMFVGVKSFAGTYGIKDLSGIDRPSTSLTPGALVPMGASSSNATVPAPTGVSTPTGTSVFVW